MAQDSIEPLLGPLPDSVYPDGWPIGSSEGHGTDYEAQELLHKPHAFALMHGDKGAKIAFGQLHWRVDCFTMKFIQDLIEVTVEDHVQHNHAHPHKHSIPSHYHVQTGYGSSSNTDPAKKTVGGADMLETGDADPEDTDICKAVLLDAEGVPVRVDGVLQDVSPGEAGNHNKHTVKLPKITYCAFSKQEAMANMSTTIPTYPEKGGTPMNPQWGDEKYFELKEYGTVYLVWQVDIEDAGEEVQDCWVQVGEPKDTSTCSAISMGNATTNRRNTATPHDGTGKPEGGSERDDEGELEEDNDEKGIFYIELGTVEEDDHVTQLVSSDVNWTPTVMDRIYQAHTSGADVAPTFTYSAD